MGRDCLAATLLAALLLGDPATGEELNSERIERRFGSYRLRVLEQDETLRVSSLTSLEDGQAVCRTLALVRFADAVPAPLRLPHAQILDGGSIGATLKRFGWTVAKTNRHIGDLQATPQTKRINALMRLAAPETLAVHIYDLDAVREDHEYRYATLIEVHHPDYLSADQLRSLYRDARTVALADSELAALTALARDKMTATVEFY